MSDLDTTQQAFFDALDYTDSERAFINSIHAFNELNRKNPVVVENVCGIDVEIRTSMRERLHQFYNDNKLPLDQIGAIGGEWSIKITPTGLGSIYVLMHVNGAELDLTDYNSW